MKIECEFLAFYEKAVYYLNQWFDFSDKNYLSKNQCLNLKENLMFDNLLAAVESLNLEDSFSMDDLYEEYTCVCPQLQTNSTGTEVDDDLNTDVIWSIIFMKAGPEKLPNLLKVDAFVISIPCSNAA
ncbi:Hypothetical predicted protein [Pelobates cultripes]|uniref:Uncharacterized protein n=1 Tax=Pelobates cultripes TaxID=61616 RepID=A0AAD1T0L7_PELCU|nr:Hypothetical predicted protein [Pelobates cultripes]